MLHGRSDEKVRLLALVDSARRGQAAVLTILGEPGVGKSALLRDLVEQVEHSAAGAGVRVLATAGVASEGPLPFAALHRLLRPVLDVDRLPLPQARALRVAFGLEDGQSAPVEPFVVGLATLSVLTEAASDIPLVCLVDDAHWLDPASAGALLFVARQLQADPIAMVFAARDGHESAFRPEGLPVLSLSGLESDAARTLLAERVGRIPPDGVVERLLGETGGNPLALLELPTGLGAQELTGEAPLPARLALTQRVERAFLDRARRASADVQTLLLVVAADDTSQVGVVGRAAQSLGAGPTAWDEAERSHLVAVTGERVAVRHPLVRSAVYQAATSLERRRVHAALADELGDDPDRQTWHRAVAVDGPAPEVADALHEVGQRAQQRGASVAAADAFVRAAALSRTDAQRSGRLFAAAANAWSSGDAARAAGLAMEARAIADEPVLRADIDRLRGRIEVNVGSATSAHRIFTRAAEQVAAHDPVRALEMAVAAAVAQSHGVDSEATLPPAAIDVDRAPADTPRTRCLKQLFVSTRHDIGGDRPAALLALREAMGTARGAPDCLADLDLLGNLANAALRLGDDEAHRRFYALMLSTARDRGDGMRVLYALQRLSFGQYVGGQWTAMRADAEEAIVLGRSVGQAGSTAAPQAWLAVLAALQGRPDYDGRLAAVEHLTTVNPPTGILAQPVQDLTRWARGVKALLGGAWTDALHQFSQMRLPALALMAAQDRIEAAVRAGDLAQALVWLDEVDAFGGATGHAWARAAATFGRAVTAQGDDKEDSGRVADLFQESLAHHAEANRPYDRARAHLAYGEFLRRHQRRLDARHHLRAALSTLDDLDAVPLADRARQELRASGETARKRDPSTVLDLTPMELKVAQLVATGLSNKDVAAQCWVSPRTVAFHLRNVFAKLGVSSRGELTQLDLG